MARYLVRIKGETDVYARLIAHDVAELRFLMDADDDPAAFEFTEDRKDEARRNWRSLIPIGETYIPSIGSVPAVVADMDAFARAARIAGCGRSE